MFRFPYDWRVSIFGSIVEIYNIPTPHCFFEISPLMSISSFLQLFLLAYSKLGFQQIDN